MTHTHVRALAARQILGALALASLVATAPAVARAVELIPSYGMSKSTDANGGDATNFGGLALRAGLLPFLNIEGGIGYRQDTFSGGDLKVRQWPVSASLWLAPIHSVYAGGGLGWYHTTMDYNDALPIKDTTTEKVGVHLGGGVQLPLAPKLGLDLNGRYVFMQADKSNIQVPTRFNPDFWTVTLGLAIKL
jgi:hypothetical protein